MSDKNDGEGAGSVSKVKLAIGAASLFLFIVGMKRTFRPTEDGLEGALPAEEALREARRSTAQDRSGGERDRPNRRS